MTLTAPAPAARFTPPTAQVRQVLIVDDEEAVCSAVGRFLRSRGYEVQCATSAGQAMDLLARFRFQLMLCDVGLPELDGIDLVPPALAADPDLAVLMLTGANDARTASRAFASGAYDYLVKPVDLADLDEAITRAVERRAAAIDQKQIARSIRDTVVVRTAELERERETLRALTVSVAETLINAMEAKDVYLRGHSQRVAELGASVADYLGLDVETVERVRLAGRLHDVGKIGIREDILNKPGRLTPEEFAHVKDHVRIGMEILSPLTHLGETLTYVFHHHEHWDGGGYPSGLAGEEITLGGRILVAADAFDAVTSRRAYREAMTAEAALAHLEGQVGRLLDGRVFAALHAVVTRRKVLSFLEALPG